MKSSQSFKKFFLREFTKSILRNTETIEITKLKKALENKKKQEAEEEERERQRISNIIKNQSQQKSNQEIKPLPRTFAPKMPAQKAPPVPQRPPQRPQMRGPTPRLRIPEPKFPSHLQYLKPRPNPRKNQLDLGKLNEIVNDSSTLEIECPGPEKEIFVRGTIGRKRTSISLTEEEIDEIINKFSEATKIPVNEGVFRAAYGNLLLSAIISEVTETKFIIRRISNPNPQPPQGMMPRR